MKKFLLSFLAALVLFASFANFFEVMAATPEPSSSPTWYNSSFSDWYGKVYDPNNPSEIFGERYTAAQVQWVVYGLFAFLVNSVTGQENSSIIQCFLNSTTDITACSDALKKKITEAATVNPVAQDIKTSGNKNLLSLVFSSDRSFSGISYIKERIQSFSIVPVAHAQTGFGFGAFDPILEIWRATRNMAFFLAIIGIIILSFMIMFRVKISPQVVISVQSAIPKVIVALILVTFSYAIAGLLVDLMYVVIGVLSLFFTQFAIAGSNPSAIFKLMTDGGILGGGFLPLMVYYFVVFFLALLVTLFGSPLFQIVSAIPFLPVAPILGFLYILVVIVVAVVLIFIVFKVLWLLIKTTAQVFLLVIFGPLQIILSTIMPSSPSVGAGAWIKALLGNLAVYPMVGALFVMAWVFNLYALKLSVLSYLADPLVASVLGINIPTPHGGWNPPLTVGADQVPLIFLGVSFAVVAIIPKTAEVIQSIISGKPFGYGQAVGEAIGPVVTLGKGGLAAGVAKYEEGRRTSMKDLYEPSAVTQALRATGVIKG